MRATTRSRRALRAHREAEWPNAGRPARQAAGGGARRLRAKIAEYRGSFFMTLGIQRARIQSGSPVTSVTGNSVISTTVTTSIRKKGSEAMATSP